MERWLNVLGGLAKLGKAEALDVLNAEGYAREYGNDMTLPISVVNTPDQVAQMRAARAQAMQKAQAQHAAMQAAPALSDAAGAAKSATEAAQNFAEIGQGGGMEAIRQMLGPSGVPNAGLAA